MKKGGLYIIWLSDTHFYGGRTSDFQGRWRNHLKALERGDHINPYMQRVFALNRVFRPEILEEIPEKAQRRQAEQGWLDMHFGSVGCLNLSPRADGGRRPLSEDERRHLSEIQKGKPRGPQTPEHRQHVSEALRGRKPSEGARQKMRAAKLGTRASAETRVKMSLSHKGKKCRARGPMSEQNREKISAALSGRSLSPEHKKKLSDAARRRKSAQETA